MNNKYLAAALIMSVSTGMIAASADTLKLPYTIAASGIDSGQQDGVYDVLILDGEPNFGTVTDNGYTSYRTAFEYDLSQYKGTVDSATLTFSIGNPEGQRQIEIHSYEGDGQAKLEDFAKDGFEASVPLAPDINTNKTIVIDVTETVLASYQAKQRYLGVSVREMPSNPPNNYVVMGIGMGTDAYGPQLILTGDARGTNQAFVVDDDYCQIADGSIFGQGFPNMVFSQDGHTVETRSNNGNINKVCKFKGVANETGTAVIYDFQDVLDYYGIQLPCITRLGELETTDWEVRISTAGSARLTCKFKE